MKPIYFPFTYATDLVVEAMAACFGQFVVYQPVTDNLPEQMQFWNHKGILDVRVPVVEDEKELKTAVKNYLDWADLHFGGTDIRATSLNALNDSLRFFESLLSSHIVADIKNQIRSGSSAKASDSLMAARIFLYFAQKFDLQSQEVEHDLKWYGQKEEDLIRELKVEDDFLAMEFCKEQVQMPNNSAEYLLTDRLVAWTRIFLKDTESSGLFVTHSPAILDHLLDRSPTAEKFLHFESIPLDGVMTDGLDSWRHNLVSKLAHAAENKQPVSAGGQADAPAFPDSGNTVSLSLYLVPDQMPPGFFSRCAEVKQYDGDPAGHAGRFKNTLIGLIEF
jgi:hypothetical protein